MFWLFGCESCGILAPNQGSSPYTLPALEGILNHQTTRESLNALINLSSPAYFG